MFITLCTIEMSEEKLVSIGVELVRNYEFKIDFRTEGVEELLMDEPAPVGEGKGPNAEMLVLAAVGNCLSASLASCLRRSKVEVDHMSTEVQGIIARNEEGRWRIKKIGVKLDPNVDPLHESQLKRCIDIFEQYCIATQSVRKGIDIEVEVVK